MSGRKVARLGFWRRMWDRFAPTPSLSPVCVAKPASRVEAELVTGFLRNSGINAHMSADDAGGTDPVYQFAFGVRVLVPPGQEAAARRLLAEAER